jgi:molybdopterin biosynthesis enzyme
VGDHDLVRPALERWGAQIAFWRVAIRPGKPLLIARRAGQMVIGLPGNPVSGLVTAHLFLRPLLRAMARRAPAHGGERSLPSRWARAANGANFSAAAGMAPAWCPSRCAIPRRWPRWRTAIA